MPKSAAKVTHHDHLQTPPRTKTRRAPKAGERRPAAAKRGPDARAKKANGRVLRSHGEDICREIACDRLATTASYCRAHYIKNWAQLKRKKAILREGRLKKFIEELISRFPDSVVNALRQDLSSDDGFETALKDLHLHEEALEDIPEVDETDTDEAEEEMIETVRTEFKNGRGGFADD